MEKFNTPYICEIKETGEKFYPTEIDYKHGFVKKSKSLDDTYSFDDVYFYRNRDFIGLHQLK